MSNDQEQAAPLEQDGAPPGRLVANEEQKAKARKFFEHAKKAADTRNYDYAIKLCVDGLALWPDAIEEGLKKLRVVATARRLEGGKALGFLAMRKYPLGGRDLAKSLKNALYLFGMDPTNIGHMEQILLLATKARCDRMAWWIAPVLADAYNGGKKLSANHYMASCAAMDQAAELAAAFDEKEAAIKILESCISVTQTWARHYPESGEAVKARGDASSKLTIVKGRFDKAEGFQESLKDAEGQADIRDRDRGVHTENRYQQLIAKARKDWEDNPNTPAKLLHLVELMARIERDEVENDAIALLEKHFGISGEYSFKLRADDLRIRQMTRHRRELQAKLKENPSDAQAHEAYVRQVTRQNEAEIAIFQDRLTHYPTDMRLRFQLGARLFAGRRYDEAIPMFQQAQLDGRCRGESRIYIGRCFYEKHFYDQARSTLQAALAETESGTNRVALELNYWLGRALEASDNISEASHVYGQLIQIDYNYRDARLRMEKLVSGDRGKSAPGD